MDNDDGLNFTHLGEGGNKNNEMQPDGVNMLIMGESNNLKDGQRKGPSEAQHKSNIER